MLYLLSFDTCIHLCNSNPIKIQNITNTPGNAFTIFPRWSLANPQEDTTVVVFFTPKLDLPVLELHMDRIVQ